MRKRRSDIPFSEQIAEAGQFIEARIEDLSRALPHPAPARLRESMLYSLTAGGKRLRPILCIKAAEVFGMPWEKSFPLALGFEMIHTGSLIQDDLPSMDNDELRRGKPTNHVIFGESLAILAGDSLLAWAFEYPIARMVKAKIPYSRICRATEILAKALGPFGLCGGQVLDTDPASMEDGDDFPFRVAAQKTGVLIAACLEGGAVIGGARRRAASAFRSYGMHLGIAFQIVDDILDVTSSAEELGKTPGKDAVLDRKTFVSVYGVEEAGRLALSESKKAVDALKIVGGDTAFFSEMADHLVERTR
ncbi:MAG: polyprenyl synthetase family protein [Synergistaceae bacterium]|nr:polyprenyl synthetase family protein [Synergistota bacterium]NLM70605.1 polyprenyl synthetase family protein [Synergistaceae bacterium]